MGRKGESLSNSLRKFAVLRDLASLPGGMGKVEEIKRIQEAKNVGCSLTRYEKHGYVEVIARVRPEGGIGRLKNVYRLTDYGRKTLETMKKLVEAGFPPIPYKYKLPPKEISQTPLKKERLINEG